MVSRPCHDREGCIPSQSSVSFSQIRRMTARALCVGALGLMLAGCDKCGDWFWIDGAAPHSCKEAPASR